MRIIGGRMRGRRLLSLRGLNTRPTTDRRRESLFNILGESVRETVALDLYAGTGALGLEALSRGAAFAAFVEIDRRALEVIRKNIDRCGAAGQAAAIRCNAAANLGPLKGLGRRFNLVFMDPPYGRTLVRPALENLLRADLLAETARVVVEHEAGDPVAEGMSAFTLTDRRKYGKTEISFLDRRRGESCIRPENE